MFGSYAPRKMYGQRLTNGGGGMEGFCSSCTGETVKSVSPVQMVSPLRQSAGTDDEMDQLLTHLEKDKHLIVLVLLSPSCHHCKMYEPTVRPYKKIIKVHNPDGQFKSKGFPHTVVVNKRTAQQVAEKYGNLPQPVLKQFLKEVATTKE